MPEADSDDERAEQSVERMRSLSAVARFLWPIPDKGLRKRLHRIKSPTLVVVADNDKIVPAAYGDQFAARIQGSRLHTVPGAGHLFMLERPAELAELMAAAGLNETAAQGAAPHGSPAENAERLEADLERFAEDLQTLRTICDSMGRRVSDLVIRCRRARKQGGPKSS